MTDLADSPDFAVGVAIGQHLADTRAQRHLHLVPTPPPDATASPRLARTFRAVDRVHRRRARELKPWRTSLTAALDARIAATARRQVAAARTIPLRRLPAFDEAGDPRHPIDVRINLCAVEDDALGRTGMRRRVRIGVATVRRHRINYAQHNPTVTRGQFHLRTVRVVRGRHEPTRAVLSLVIAVGVSAAAGLGFAAAVWLPRALAAISALAGKAATILLLAAIVAVWIRSADKSATKEHP